MHIPSIAFFTVLALGFAACQLRIDNQQRTLGYSEDSVATTPSIVEDSLPPMSEIRRGYYAMLVTGKSSSFIKGLYRGEATFANTSTPIINSSGIRGNIKKEFSFLYSQGLIRKLKIYFSGEPAGEQNYPLLPYEKFKKSVPKDSVAATYIIASNYLFDSRQGRVELHSVNENQVQGTLNGSFVSDRGDSIQVRLNFKAIRE